MLLQILRTLIVLKSVEHGTVPHAMPVHKGVEIGEIRVVPTFHKNGPTGVALLLPIVLQIKLVILTLQNGIGNRCIRNDDPSHHIGIFLLQFLQSHVQQGPGFGIIKLGDRGWVLHWLIRGQKGWLCRRRLRRKFCRRSTGRLRHLRHWRLRIRYVHQISGLLTCLRIFLTLEPPIYQASCPKGQNQRKQNSNSNANTFLH